MPNPSLLPSRIVATASLSLLAVMGCSSDEPAPGAAAVRAFAEEYTAAWNSLDPARMAAHFTMDGSLTINGGTPSVGRDAIGTTAESFMVAFPDMHLTMDKLEVDGNRAVYHWTFVGTNTGPGGTGSPVRFSGYEEWTFAPDGLIVQSLGHFDQADYDRQLQANASTSPAPTPEPPTPET